MRWVALFFIAVGMFAFFFMLLFIPVAVLGFDAEAWFAICAILFGAILFTGIFLVIEERIGDVDT